MVAMESTNMNFFNSTRYLAMRLDGSLSADTILGWYVLLEKKTKINVTECDNGFLILIENHV